MASQVTFTVHARSDAPPQAVYRLLADGATWPRWSPIDGFDLEREGRDGGESAGAVRAFRTGPVRSREELLELRPDEALHYTALSGLPIRGHRAEVTLTADGAGTAITWYEAFEPKLPGTGWWLRWFLGRFVQRCADGLAAHAATTRRES
jgi:uncharacterized protein YndB with AHSA1/START domain